MLKTIEIVILKCVLFLFLINFSCNQKEIDSIPSVYDGPISIMKEVYLVNSDSGKITTILIADKQMEYISGNMEFPKGIEIVFLNETGNIKSKITANKGFYNKKENLYYGKEDVNFENFENNQKLSSEELFWNPNSKKIFTNVFVVIKDDQRIIRGTGFESDETFSNYKIFNSHGEMPIPGD